MSEREQQPSEVDPAELGNYEGVAGGDVSPQSGDPAAGGAEQQGVGEDEPAEEAGPQ